MGHGRDHHTADSLSSHDKIPSRQNRQYIRESKEWLTAYDWKKVRPKVGFIIRILLKVQHTPYSYIPEGCVLVGH